MLAPSLGFSPKVPPRGSLDYRFGWVEVSFTGSFPWHDLLPLGRKLLLKKDLTVFYFMDMDALPECLSVHHMCAWCPGRSEKTILDPLGLELKMVVSHHVAGEN